jgi:hypothetical protein
LVRTRRKKVGTNTAATTAIKQSKSAVSMRLSLGPVRAN